MEETVSKELSLMLMMLLFCIGFIIGWGAKSNDQNDRINTLERALAALDTVRTVTVYDTIYSIPVGTWVNVGSLKSDYVKLQIQTCHDAYLWMLANRPYPPERSWQLTVKWWEKQQGD